MNRKQQVIDDVQAIVRNYRYGGGLLVLVGLLIGLIVGAQL
jgi:hypothetical protein